MITTSRWICGLAVPAVLFGCRDQTVGVADETSAGGSSGDAPAASSTGAGTTETPSTDGTGSSGSSGASSSGGDTTEGSSTGPVTAPLCEEHPDDGPCVPPADDCSCFGCEDDGICGALEDCVCDDCDDAPACVGVCDGDGLCDVAREGCGCTDCEVLARCDDFGSPCGDGICDPDVGEDACACPSDCPDDPDACEPCECGGSGGNCSCAVDCMAASDCCANACTADACGADIPGCVWSAGMDGVCDAELGENSCNDPTECPDDPSSCSPCECGGSGGDCACDPDCMQRGDCCADVCSLAACGGAAQCFTELETAQAVGLGLVIPDDGYDGTLASMACTELDVAADGTDVLGYVEVELRIDHDFVGDLTVRLVSAQGTAVTLLARPGSDAPDDGSNLPFGTNADLLSSFPVRFGMAATWPAEWMGLDAFGVPLAHVCADDGVCDFVPADDLAALVGEDSAGTWTVCVGDAVGADLGTLVAVRLRLGQSA